MTRKNVIFVGRSVGPFKLYSYCGAHRSTESIEEPEGLETTDVGSFLRVDESERWFRFAEVLQRIGCVFNQSRERTDTP